MVIMPRKFHNHAGKMPHEGRASNLVVDDTDGITRLPEPQHGFDKVGAMRAENPGVPKNNMSVIFLRNSSSSEALLRR